MSEIINKEEINEIVNKHRYDKNFGDWKSLEDISQEIAAIVYSRLKDVKEYFYLKRGHTYYKPAGMIIINYITTYLQESLRPVDFYRHHIESNLRRKVEVDKLEEKKEYFSVNDFFNNLNIKTYSISATAGRYSLSCSRNIESNETAKLCLGIYSKIFDWGVIVYTPKKNIFRAYLIEDKCQLTEITLRNALKIYDDFKTPEIKDWKEPFKGKIRGVYHKFTNCVIVLVDDKILRISRDGHRISKEVIKYYDESIIDYVDSKLKRELEKAAVVEAI